MLLLCLVLASVYAAESVDDPMGIYEGTYTASSGDSGRVTLKVIAMGGGSYRAVAQVENYYGPRIEIDGKTRNGKTLFSGSVDLGPDLGGVYRVQATLSGPDVSGTFKGDIADGTIKLKKVEKPSPTLAARPPQGATILFDGRNLNNWQEVKGGPAEWKVTPDGGMEVVKGNIISKQKFGDAKIHLEFRIPFMPEARGQARGNSGVYIQGRYEIQLLDSFGLTPRDNECGGIYQAAVPRADACLPPLEWQTYDIAFQAPQLDEQGKKVKNAVISVELNGVLIHDKVSLSGPTPGAIEPNEVAAGGILLQDHGNPVQFRNIWVAPLPK